MTSHSWEASTQKKAHGDDGDDEAQEQEEVEKNERGMCTMSPISSSYRNSYHFTLAHLDFLSFKSN